MKNKRRIFKYIAFTLLIVALLVMVVIYEKKDNENKTKPQIVETFPEIFDVTEEFMIEAHRGFCDEFPENTLIAFEEAGKAEAYFGIETDVQMTSDGILVCMHDNSLARTTNAEGRVDDYTYDELMGFFIDGGYGWSEEYNGRLRIPTLSDFLDICIKYNKIPYIELKQIDDDGMKKLLAMLSEKGLEGKCVFTSFKLKNIKKMAGLTDKYPLEYMTKEDNDKSFEEIITSIRDIKNIVYRPSVNVVTEELSRLCEEKGILLEAYGLAAGDYDMMNKLADMGVAGATCNSYKGLK